MTCVCDLWYTFRLMETESSVSVCHEPVNRRDRNESRQDFRLHFLQASETPGELLNRFGLA